MHVFVADSAPVVKETNVQAYLDRVEKVEAEASSLLAKTLKLEEQRQLLEFKNRVLTEMVSACFVFCLLISTLHCLCSLRYHNLIHKKLWQSSSVSA